MNSSSVCNNPKKIHAATSEVREENKPGSSGAKESETSNTFIRKVTQCMDSARIKFDRSQKAVDRIAMCQVNTTIKNLLETRAKFRKSGVMKEAFIKKLTFYKLAAYIKRLVKENHQTSLMYKATKAPGYQTRYKGTAAAILKLIDMHQQMEEKPIKIDSRYVKRIVFETK